MHTDRLRYCELLTTTVRSNETLGVALRAWMAQDTHGGVRIIISLCLDERHTQSKN